MNNAVEAIKLSKELLEDLQKEASIIKKIGSNKVREEITIARIECVEKIIQLLTNVKDS